MTEGGMADIVGKTDSLHKAWVRQEFRLSRYPNGIAYIQLRQDAAANLRYLHRVSQPCAVEVALAQTQHLRLRL